MSKERMPTPERAPSKYDQAISLYQKHRPKDVTSPFDPRLDKNPENVKAFKLFGEWQAEVDAEAGEDQHERRRANLEKTIFFIQAGFRDENFLNDTLGYLYQDLQDARVAGDHETARKIKEWMKEIVLKLPLNAAEKKQRLDQLLAEPSEND